MKTSLGKGLLALTIGLASLSAYAYHDKDKDDDHHRRTNATDMSLLGLAAASVLGAGAYLVIRQRSKSRT